MTFWAKPRQPPRMPPIRDSWGEAADELKAWLFCQAIVP